MARTTRPLRAEDIYKPPPHLPEDAWADVPAGDLVLRWHEIHAQRRLPVIPRDQVAADEPLIARIDAGRWIAECPCGSAHAVTPADPWLLCPVCLDAWHPLVFPADVPAAEAEIAELPRRAQFWYHPTDVKHSGERLRQIAERDKGTGGRS